MGALGANIVAESASGSIGTGRLGRSGVSAVIHRSCSPTGMWKARGGPGAAQAFAASTGRRTQPRAVTARYGESLAPIRDAADMSHAARVPAPKPMTSPVRLSVTSAV